MASIFDTIKQAEEILDEVLRVVRNEQQSPHPALSEVDQSKVEEEVQSLRSRVKEIAESPESNAWGIRRFFGSPPPRPAECLEEAEKLHQRVKEDIEEKRRMTPIGDNLLGLHFTPVNTGTAETNVPADDTSRRASTIVRLPLDTRRSVSEVSEPNVDPTTPDDRDYAIDLCEAINTPLGMSSNQGRQAPTPRRGRALPLPLPPPRRTPQSSNARILLQTMSEQRGGTPRRSPSVRGPAPPQSPRQTRTFRSPINTSSRPSTQSPLDAALISSLTDFAQQMSTLGSSMAKQAHGQQGLRYSDGLIGKTNCVNIKGSNVDGLTVNNGGRNNSGAVIHKVMMPPRSPQHTSQL